VSKQYDTASPEYRFAEEFREAFGKDHVVAHCDEEIYDEALDMYIWDRLCGITSCAEEFITKYGDFRDYREQE